MKELVPKRNRFFKLLLTPAIISIILLIAIYRFIVKKNYFIAIVGVIGLIYMLVIIVNILRQPFLSITIDDDKLIYLDKSYSKYRYSFIYNEFIHKLGPFTLDEKSTLYIYERESDNEVMILEVSLLSREDRGRLNRFAKKTMDI